MGKTSWEGDCRIDAVEEITDAKPEHVSADVACQAEVERMVGKYNQQGEHGEVYALDGKAVRGMRKKDDEEWREYMLSVHDVEQRKVLSQVEVGRKENEITKAPKALECVEISQKGVCQEGCVNGLNNHDCNLPAAAQQRADCAQPGSLPSNRIAS